MPHTSAPQLPVPQAALTSPAARPETADAAAPPLGRRYDTGERRLMLHRSGTGGPAVVFLAGAGQVGLDYLNAHNRIAERTTSVLYDRGGTGWSDAVELPRTAAAVTDELRALLRTAAVPAPYVFVGHSLGGAYARHYAQRFPADVAGLLLLDPFHEDLHANGPQQARDMVEQLNSQEMPEPTPEQLQQAREQAAPLFANWPEAVRGPLLDHHLAAWKTGLYESRNLYDEVAAELRAAPGLPDIPMIVLTALGHDNTQAQLWPDDVLRAINDAKNALHAQLSASVPRGEHRILADAGHGWIHEERQDAVLEAVADLCGGVGG
ncbi:alpha/beta fold hydrolase [Streptomyces gilvosporeus]|uniref:Alpha/beta hydrolase n=1 Tax=Streptomyces gilvosporeus TaxID=553510 RepID=A0A1V0U1K0_9ACTN|nr:alpha/beta hydrolase [Streptomyces gilvosporeus]ARF59094.1 alpha/beta hydrolase [Streptomyces gilvosporeus]